MYGSCFRKPSNKINLPPVPSVPSLYFKVIWGRSQKPTSDFHKGPRELYEPFCFTRRNLRAEPTWVPRSELWHSDQIYGQIWVIMVVKLEEITFQFSEWCRACLSNVRSWRCAAAPKLLTTSTCPLQELTLRFKIETIENNNRHLQVSSCSLFSLSNFKS